MNRPLDAEIVTLRPPTEADVDVLYEFQRDRVAVEMAAFPARDYETFRAKFLATIAEPTSVARIVVVGGRVAGSIGSWLAEDRRMLGYWFGRDFWGRGVATRALAELLPSLAERPIFANVVKHNVASRRVLEKNGFVVIGEEAGVDHNGQPDESWVLRLD